MKYKALLFGSIGTLIESSNIQRNSFNEAFKEGICLLKLQAAREIQRRINANKNQKLVYI